MSTIKWSPTTSMKINKPPGTCIIGSPGAGKTFAMLNFAANCIGMGERVIAIDPKNDFRKLYNINPNIDIIDVNDIAPGALNPFEFLKSVNKDTGKIEYIDSPTVLTIIELICGKLDSTTFTSIQPIVQDFVTKNKNDPDTVVAMKDVADYLFQNKKLLKI